MNSAAAKFYKPILWVLIVSLLVGASRLQQGLNREREKMGLTRLKPLENAPPLLAFTTVALGGFRGLIANILYVRASQLQEDDKYFEMVQLSDWITKLEPHLLQVWTVQAWNMAYNISVKFPDAADRWRWVRKGIELLRDEALKYNPDEELIYQQLGWLFQHKLGQNLDDAQMYYKTAWAWEMQNLLGGVGLPNYDELLHPKTPEQIERVRVMEEVYKLHPKVMKEVDDHYGPLDWRLPEAHSIYWAWLGLKKAKPEKLLELRRMIYQSMQLAFYRGALTLNKFGGYPVLGPNLAMVDNANRAYEEAMRDDPESAEHISIAHKNYLTNLPYYLYIYNRRAEAE